MTPISPQMPDVLLHTPSKFGDERGFFSETFSQRWVRDAGLDIQFVQDNHAYSKSAGVIRGLHFQYGTAPQAKLVRCIAGAILDVAVDIRRGSATFGQFVTAEISADNWSQIFVPAGFAHGYCTLKPDTEVLYKVDQFYDPSQEAAIRWDDPALGIAWPYSASDATLSDKDCAAPLLADSPAYFQYEKGNGPFNMICLDGNGDAS